MRRFGLVREINSHARPFFVLAQVVEKTFSEKAGALGEIAGLGRATLPGIARKLGEGTNPVQEIGLGGSEEAGRGGGDGALANSEHDLGLAEEFGALLRSDDFAELQERRGLRLGGVGGRFDNGRRRRRLRLSCGDAALAGRGWAID